MSPKATKHDGAVLFSEMTPDPAWEAEFNDWYDSEHIPLRMAVPGFLSAQRYRAASGAGYLAVYEMQSAAVLQSPAYERVKKHPSERTTRMLRSVTGFTRYVGEPIGATTPPDKAMDAPFLYAVFFAVREFHDEYFNHPSPWPVRGFRITSGEPGNWTHLALHYLADAHRLPACAGWFERHDALFERHGPRHTAS